MSDGGGRDAHDDAPDERRSPLDDLFGAEADDETADAGDPNGQARGRGDSEASGRPAPAGRPAAPAPAGRPAATAVIGHAPTRRGQRGRRHPDAVLWVAAVAGFAVVVAGAFFAGARIGDRGPTEEAASRTATAPATAVASATSTPTPTPTPTPTAPPTATAPTAPAAPGVHPWTALFGGECLQPFPGAFASEFAVVDCSTAHAAQLVRRVDLGGDASSPYPGAAELASRTSLTCEAQGVLDPAAASAIGDLVVTSSYPATAEDWRTQPHVFLCFVSRSGGEALTTTIAGPGPAS